MALSRPLNLPQEIRKKKEIQLLTEKTMEQEKVLKTNHSPWEKAVQNQKTVP